MSLQAPHHENRVLLMAPTRRDGEVTHALLGGAGIDCIVCSDLQALALELRTGAGALVMTDGSLTDPAMEALSTALREQPPWSDVPILLLTQNREHSPYTAQALAALSNVTLLDRPSSTRAMVSAVASALRSRRRQYEIRDRLVELLKAEQALRDADVRKDEFLATLAHELRNPLAAIRMGLTALKRSAENDRAARTVGMIDRQSRLLVKLIDDLLDVSRIATGKVALDMQTLDLRTVVELALETGQAVLQSAQHQVRVALPAAPVWVVGDASRLAQVIGNLLNNASKYTPDGGRISVSLTHEGPQALLQVTDTGVGIPPDMLHQVFDMFTQVNRTLDRAQGGLGIGLSLVQRLLVLHRGSVQALSAGTDQGSTFAIRLPIAAVPGARDTPEGTAPAQPNARPLRILVVDDNPDVADALSSLLNGEGHALRTEYGGAAALSAAHEFRPDVVFCDIGMPGVDGHQVAAQLRAEPGCRSTLLVAVTGWGTDEHKRRTQAAGFDLHLTKPLSEEVLRDVLARV